MPTRFFAYELSVAGFLVSVMPLFPSAAWIRPTLLFGALTAGAGGNRCRGVVRLAATIPRGHLRYCLGGIGPEV